MKDKSIALDQESRAEQSVIQKQCLVSNLLLLKNCLTGAFYSGLFMLFNLFFSTRD